VHSPQNPEQQMELSKLKTPVAQTLSGRVKIRLLATVTAKAPMMNFIV